MNTIYVFTSTGNSLKIAKEIAATMGNTEIRSIPAMMKNEKWKIEGGKVGFVFPCYYGSMPHIIERFISNAEDVNGAYFFSIVTAGGNTGYSLKKLNESLKKRNHSLNYGRSLIVASNYMNGWYYKMILPEKEELKKRFENLVNISQMAADDIKADKNYMEKQKYAFYLIPRLLSPTRYVKDTRPWDSEFSVSSDCNGCGICADICPVENITMTDGKPQFNHNCQRCMGCIQFCPKKAFSIEGKLMNKTHYSHPDIKLKELVYFNKNGII